MSEFLIDDLVDWLAAQTELAVGDDLCASLLPEDAELASMVLDTGGPPRPFSPVMPKTFQVLTRGPDYAATTGRATQLYNVIYPPPARLPVRNVDLSDDWRALSIDAIQPPADMGVNEVGKRQVVFNIQVRAVRIN